MCLGVPGKIMATEGDGIMRTGRVDFGGTERLISLAYVPDATPGDWVVVHVGFALNTIDEAEAKETLALLQEIAAMVDEPESSPPASGTG